MATTQDNRLLNILTPLGKDFLLLNRITATEEISSLFSYEVELLHAEESPGFEPTAIDAKSILGKAVTIEIDQRVHRTKRTFSGMVNHFSQGHRDTRFSYYHATIVPHIWLLTQVSQSRIFQHKTVPDILKEVFKGFSVSYELQGDFKPRNYCVQYRETDFDFASRLMEEEGIYYFFEHTEGKHKMILGNTPQSHPDCPIKSDIPFALRVSDEEDYITSIRKWQNDHRLQSGKVSFRDYHFQIPTNKLDAEQPSLFQVGGNDKMELYDYPAGPARKYDDIDRGGGERADVQNVFEDKQKRAEIAMQAIDSQYRVITGYSDCSSMTAGYRFNFFDHPSADQNGQYVLTSVTHEAEQNPTYVTDDEIEQPYTNSFTCIAYGKGNPPFRPVRKTQKPIVQGSQTAVVVGPSGEEIFTDKYGRVKVQFHWDRENTYNPDSSCWVRVAHDIAGKKWGEMHIPRIGQEVIIDFIEGDPDQPIITGSVYNQLSMPHYELPKYKTLTYLKTRTSPDDGKGFNELRFEDKQGKEQVFIHSQKRMDTRVRESYYETCGGNRQELIGMRTDNKPGGNLAVSVGGNHDFHVKYDEFIGIDGKRYEKVVKDVVEGYKGDKSTIITGKSEQNAREIIIEAGMKISLKVGGNCIVIDPTGITIAGTPTVKINSGGFGTETSSPMLGNPLDAEPADTGEPGYLDRPRTGGGRGGRVWEQLNSQHYVAPPRPGEDPRMTAIRNTLRNSAAGRHALEVYDRYGITSTFNTGVGGSYDPSTNSMNLDPAWGDYNNTAFVHEMNHGQSNNEHTSADIVNQSRADYVDTELREEAHGDAVANQAARELAAAGHPQTTPPPNAAAYNAAYNRGVQNARAANPNATQAELDAAGQQAAETQLLDDYRNGRITPSDVGGVRQPPYNQYYGNAWDRAHPAPPTP